MDYNRNPILLVGAPRSGTKMLRELMKLHPCVKGELFEEERIWCWGNSNAMYSYLSPSVVTREIRQHIRQHFFRKISKENTRFIDKNTCNSLRLDYVRSIFPESKIIHIIRDGRSATASLRVRWQRPFDWRYILREKAFPIKELPFFISRQIRYNVHRFMSKGQHAGLYGPRFEGIRQTVKSEPLLKVCALQWMSCVCAVLESKNGIPGQQFHEVRYEQIVKDPVSVLSSLFDYLEIEIDTHFLRKANKYVQETSLDKWKRHLTQTDLNLLEETIGHVQKSIGYC